MLLSEEIIALYITGQVSDVLLRDLLLNEEYYFLTIPQFLKPRVAYYKNTSMLSSSCVWGFCVSMSYYMYLVLLNCISVAHTATLLLKLLCVIAIATIFCLLCRYTSVFPELEEHYHRHTDVVTAVLVDIAFAFVLSAICMLYVASLRNAVLFVHGLLLPPRRV